MPNDGYRNNGDYGNRGGSNYGQNNRGGYNDSRKSDKEKKDEKRRERYQRILETKQLDPDSDYVSDAEKWIRELEKEEQLISTSKVRNFLSMVSTIYDRELRSGKATLSDDSISALSLMRIRLAYECGRDDKTMVFVEKTKLINYLKGITDGIEPSSAEAKKRFMAYAHYVEAIIAFHRFYGGKE